MVGEEENRRFFFFFLALRARFRALDRSERKEKENVCVQANLKQTTRPRGQLSLQ